MLISYNSADRADVLRLTEALKNLGIRAWLDVWEIIPGERWQPQLQKALKKIRQAIVCIGPKGKGPWQDLEMDVLLKKAVKEKAKVIPVLLPKAPANPKLEAFWDQMHSVDLRHWEQPDDPGLNTLVGAIFGESPGKMRNIQVDAPWVKERRQVLTRRRQSSPQSSQVLLTLHKNFGSDKKTALEAVRAQIAARLNIPADTVRIVKEQKGSVKITLEFENAEDASRLLAQVQAGNQNILSLFERVSARKEEFLAENKAIHFHGPAAIHGPVAVGDKVIQKTVATKDDASAALLKLNELIAAHVTASADLAESKKLLGGAQAELDEEQPDQEKIAKRTSRIVTLLKNIGGGAKWFNDVLKCGQTVAEYCGKYGPMILAALG